jgi:hypothetical protein
MEFVYHIVTICVNETSWAHIWRLRSRYLGTGYDIFIACSVVSALIFSKEYLYSLLSISGLIHKGIDALLLHF